jgi:hypothetical protein
MENKTKILLEWDNQKGKYRRYILNISTKHNESKEEEYFIATQNDGYM